MKTGEKNGILVALRIHTGYVTHTPISEMIKCRMESRRF